MSIQQQNEIQELKERVAALESLRNDVRQWVREEIEARERMLEQAVPMKRGDRGKAQ